MENADSVFISQTLAVTAFYCGIAGGFVALGLVHLVRFLARALRGAFAWR
jgi:hypothetical protein